MRMSQGNEMLLVDFEALRGGEVVASLPFALLPGGKIANTLEGPPGTTYTEGAAFRFLMQSFSRSQSGQVDGFRVSRCHTHTFHAHLPIDASP